jgi:hypothetical protein
MAFHRRTGAQLTTEPTASSPPGPGRTRPAARDEPAARPQGRRWWKVAAWSGGVLLLFAFLVRTALTQAVDSDGANNALQAWDILHGNLLLHHWIIGDATYYTFDLPVFALTEVFFGLHSVVLHIAPAITCLVVAVFAMVLAATGSRGLAAFARCCVAVAVIVAAFPTPGSYGTWMLLGKPDHFATGAFLLASFLLIDRAPRRAFTPPVLFLILCAGQIGDALVLYVAVPTIVLVTLYRAAGQTIAARRTPWREGIPWRDLLVGVAAVVSVPAAAAIRSLMVHLGGYVMIAPDTRIGPWSQLGHNAYLTWHGIQYMFGVINTSGSPFGPVYGYAALLAVLIGFGRVVWTWKRASAAEQLLFVAAVVNLGAYMFSNLPVNSNPREMAFLLPAGGVLAARALVPASIRSARRAAIAAAAAVAVVLMPLVAGATQPVRTPLAARLAGWLTAHHLTYGIAGYWDASDVTVASSDKVEVRPVRLVSGHLAGPSWEISTYWYNSGRNRATFAIAHSGRYTTSNVPASVFEQYLGLPTAIYTVGSRQVLVYDYNILTRVVLAARLGRTG